MMKQRGYWSGRPHKKPADRKATPPSGRSPSFAELSKVLTHKELPLKANERLVAVVIFQHVRMTDMKCWPSIEEIRRRAKVGRNTVSRTIKLLKELGLMTVEKERSNGKFKRNVYDFSNIKNHSNRVPR